MQWQRFLFLAIFWGMYSCGIYSFTGGDVGDAKTIQVDYFQNNAALVQPGVSQKFTLAMQDLFLRQTDLSLVQNNPDLLFEGEIVNYNISPTTATAQQTAAQSRLTIVINVRFFNNLDEKKNFEKRFTHFYDFDASQQLIGGTLDTALEQIFDRITQDIFNASLANW